MSEVKLYKCPIITALACEHEYDGPCVNPGYSAETMRHHLLENNWSHEKIEAWEKREGIK